MNSSVNAVVCCPPLNPEIVTKPVACFGIRREVRDRREHILLLKAGNHLSNAGMGFFLVSRQFFDEREDGALSTLHEFNLHLNGVFPLSPDCAPGLGEPVCLVAFSLVPSERIFLASLEPDTDPAATAESFARLDESHLLTREDLLARLRETA